MPSSSEAARYCTAICTYPRIRGRNAPCVLPRAWPITRPDWAASLHTTRTRIPTRPGKGSSSARDTSTRSSSGRARLIP